MNVENKMTIQKNYFRHGAVPCSASQSGAVPRHHPIKKTTVFYGSICISAILILVLWYEFWFWEKILISQGCPH